MTHVVIIGGGYAGSLMALRLANKVGNKATITVVDGKDHFVERIRLHQLATDQKVRQRPYTELFEGTSVRFVHGWATQIDPTHQNIKVQIPSGETTLDYDYLGYALGSVTDTTKVQGIKEFAYTIGEEAQAMKLRTALVGLAAKGGRVVIVGGGLTGIETATEIAETYPSLKVQVVTRSRLGEGLSDKGRAHLYRVFAKLGITLREHTTVSRIQEKMLVSQQGNVPFDVCVWAGSFRALPLAQTAGLAVNARGQVIVDTMLRVPAHPTIYAVGDATDLSYAIDTPIRMACATGMPMGAFAGGHIAATILGQPAPDLFRFGYLVQCISLGRKEGLVQRVDTNDRAQERIMTGKPAVWLKELICRFVSGGLSIEKRFPFYGAMEGTTKPLSYEHIHV